MSTSLDQSIIDDAAARMCRSRHVHGAVLAVYDATSGERFTAAAGDLRPDRQFFVASVTKLLITIVVMRLVEENRISLDDPLTRHLPSELLERLHVRDGEDRTGEITIRHLISSHSGLPDYFSLKGPDGRRPFDTLAAGEDTAWPLERTLEAARRQRPRFAPGQPGKVAYSDTNYQLLGRILEGVTGEPLPRVFESLVFEPLGLRQTYAYTDIGDDRPARMYAGARQVHLPRYMASITAEGGVVSTADDLLEIGRAFFEGTFFDIDRFLAQQNWRLLFWPGQFYFGMGLEKMWTPWFFSPLRPIRDVMGFWGQSGAFLFHHPTTGLHFAGTVNQITGRGHASAVRAMLRIIAAHAAAHRRNVVRKRTVAARS